MKIASIKMDIDFNPLIEATGMSEVDNWHFIIGYLMEDGTRIYCYKNIDYRNYLNLTSDKRAFKYVGVNQYEEVDFNYAVSQAVKHSSYALSEEF